MREQVVKLYDKSVELAVLIVLLLNVSLPTHAGAGYNQSPCVGLHCDAPRPPSATSSASGVPPQPCIPFPL